MGTASVPTGTAILIPGNAELRHKLADNDTADLNNPVPIPSSGTKYAWRRYTKLRVVSGLGTQVGNLRWFAVTAPSDWAGTVFLFAGITPSFMTCGSATDEATQLGGTQNADLYTSSAPLTVPNISGTVIANQITQNNSYGNQMYVLQQIGVASTATSGVKTARVCTYRIDEV
jgi:hypothetical protein